MDTRIYNIQIRALICHEGDEFVATALEMDLLGYGRSEIEAVEELKRAVEAQFSFALQMNDPSLLEFPSGDDYFKRWEDCQRKALRSQVLGDKPGRLQAKAVIITITPAEMKVLRTRTFANRELVCA